MHICVSSVIAGQEVWPQSQFVSLLIVFPLLEVGGWLSLLGVDALCGVVVHARAGVVTAPASQSGVVAGCRTVVAALGVVVAVAHR